MNHEILSKFLASARGDARICPGHICLYVAIFEYARMHDNVNPICAFARELMEPAKISSVSTYHKMIRDLHSFGYIQYTPSYNHFLGSLVYIK